MHEGRVDVIGGGSIVVEELADALGQRAGIDELVVSEHDILDGIALSLPERSSGSIRLRSAARRRPRSAPGRRPA